MVTPNSSVRPGRNRRVATQENFPEARQEGHVFPEVERVRLWDALVSRLRQLPRYQNYVAQEIRPLWRDMVASEGSFIWIAEHLLEPSEVQTRKHRLERRYLQKLFTHPAQVFGLVTTSGLAPLRIVRAIHEDVIAREIATREARAKRPHMASTLPGPKSNDIKAIAQSLGESFGFALNVMPARMELHTLPRNESPLRIESWTESIPTLVETFELPLSDGVAFDEDYWIRAKQEGHAVVDRIFDLMREQIKAKNPPKRRPSGVQKTLADVDLLFDWLVLKTRPADRAKRRRVLRLADQLGLRRPPTSSRATRRHQAA